MIPDWLTPKLRFTLLGLGVGQIINWGVLYYTLALIGPHIVRETGWSEGFVYSGFAVATIATGMFSPLSGQMIDRLGGSPVMLAGTLIGAIGMALMALSWHWPVYLLAWAIIGVGMSACLYDSTFAAIARFAGSTTRKSISLVTLIAGFASTVSWPATSALLLHFTWREVVVFDAVLMVAVSMPAIYFGLKKTDSIGLTLTAAPSTAQDHTSETIRPILNEQNFPAAMILFAILLTALGFVANALSVHIITLFQTLGIDAGSALLAGALIGPAQVGARVLELAFGRRLSAIGLGLLPVVLMPIAFIIPLALGSNSAVAVLFGLVYGAANGLATIARGVVPYALFGPNGYGRRLGLLSAPALIVKAAAPALFATILAAYGPFTALLFALGVSLLATAAMMGLTMLVRRT